MAAVVYTEKGQQLSLSTEIGKGGEGTIYLSPNDPLECAKIYLRPAPEHTRNKLRLMVQNPPADPTYQTRKHRSISWPSNLLYQDVARTRFVGFFMPKIDLKAFQKALVYLDPSDRCARFGGGFTWKYLFTAATNVASAVAAIHGQGYCVGDLNESNILIAPNALVSLIDCDSFQVRDSQSGRVYRCEVGKPEYTAPEIVGKRYDEVDRTIASDSFGLAVLIFQLLMDGTHPYQAKGTLVEDAPNTESKIMLGYFPYAMRGGEIAPPDHAPPYEILHPEMQKLFQQCFVTGHGNPKVRPTAREWYESLRKLDSKFKQCSKNANHEYLDHLRSCPWCKLQETRNRDPFPSPVGHQVALENTAAQLDSLEKRLEYLRPYVVMAFADGVLTNEEQSYLTALGGKLQIPAKELEKAIQAEAKRVQGKMGSSPGSPQLELSQTNFEFQNIRRGTALSGRYLINNVGGGSLQGRIRSTRPWLKPSQSAIDAARHRQEHGFSVDSSNLALGSKNWGAIEIESNGGNAQVQVSVSIEIEKSALARYGRSLLAIGFLVGGLFGYFLYTLLPDFPSKTAVSAIAGIAGLIGAIVVGSRSGGFFGGCGGFFIGSFVLGAFQFTMPIAFSVLAWATTFASLLHSTARPLFVGKEARKSAAFIGVAAGLVILATAIILGGISLKDHVDLSKLRGTTAFLAPTNSQQVIMDQLSGSSSGITHGIKWVHALGDHGATFSAESASRIEYPEKVPREGTIEVWIKVDSGYRYDDFKFRPNLGTAMIFSTDAQGGDVTWPGTAKLFVSRNGTISFWMATSKYNQPAVPATEARETKFRFGKWHALGVSYGSQGQYIMLDGTVVASNNSRTQMMGAAGNHQASLDVPTIGETASHFWVPHRYEGGFEGILGMFRASTKQRDWSLAKGIGD